MAILVGGEITFKVSESDDQDHLVNSCDDPLAQFGVSEPLRVASPRILLDGGFVPYKVDLRRTYDMAPDGQIGRAHV